MGGQHEIDGVSHSPEEAVHSVHLPRERSHVQKANCTDRMHPEQANPWEQEMHGDSSWTGLSLGMMTGSWHNSEKTLQTPELCAWKW